jgi:LuxR family maltose regulon positive regulatory protein
MLLDFAPAAGFGPREARQVRAGLAELPETVTLVLDDFHLVDDRAVLESIGQLLEHQPPQLRLVILTRSDPTLRLNRLRINGDLTDIRADDLAFTRDEAVELLHGNGLHPSPV